MSMMHRFLGLIVVVLLLSTAVPGSLLAAPFVEIKDCRPPEEDGEFLQSCVKMVEGKRSGQILGPGLVAPTGQYAAVVQHRRYGRPTDRVTLRIYGPTGRLQGTYPMSSGDEYDLFYPASSDRYLAWVETDGRGGQLRLLDLRRQRIVLSAITPLDSWPIFSPRDLLLMIPRRGAGADLTDDRVGQIEAVELPSRRRMVVLSAQKDEELIDLHWLAPDAIGATLLAPGQKKGKVVRGVVGPRVMIESDK
jgi:hypothetical protein